MVLHAFSSCDMSNVCRGVVKIRTFKTLLKMPKYVPILAKLGICWNPDDLLHGLEAFTCTVYSWPRVRSVKEFRHLRINEFCVKTDRTTPSKNFDIATILSCKWSWEQHTRRVNFHVAIWMWAYILQPDIPDPSTGHGCTLIHDNLEPLWYEGDLLPQKLVDIPNPVPCNDDDDVSLAAECVLDCDDSDSDRVHYGLWSYLKY